MAHDFVDQIEEIREALDRIEEDTDDTTANAHRLVDVLRLLRTIIVCDDDDFDDELEPIHESDHLGGA